MKTRLDSFEREIEKSASAFRPVSKKRLRKVESIIERVRKTRNVNIRLSENVLEQLKRRSQNEGLPYQTLIASILHKYVTDKLVDEEAIRKSVKLLLHKESFGQASR
jgi:predicted DNA binding CopG/RHH family protein